MSGDISNSIVVTADVCPADLQRHFGGDLKRVLKGARQVLDDSNALRSNIDLSEEWVSLIINKGVERIQWSQGNTILGFTMLNRTWGVLALTITDGTSEACPELLKLYSALTGDDRALTLLGEQPFEQQGQVV